MPRALLQVIDGFLEAQMQSLEDERLEYFLMLLADLDHLLSESASTGGQLQQNPVLAPIQTTPQAPAGLPPARGAPPQLAA